MLHSVVLTMSDHSLMVELHSKGGGNDSDQISQVGTIDEREGWEGIISWHQCIGLHEIAKLNSKLGSSSSLSS